jgi:hypothetical protein
VTDCTYEVAQSVIRTTAAKSSSSFTFQFSLSDLPNVAEFTTLFDQYMITGVMLQIKMVNNPDGEYVINTNPLTGNNASFYPTLWYVADHDDRDTVSLAQIKEFDKVRHKVLRPNTEINIMLRPTTLTQIYRSALTTGYACNFKRQWLDVANTDIPHYGCKCVIDFEGVTPAVLQFDFKINARYFFKCKNVR